MIKYVVCTSINTRVTVCLWIKSTKNFFLALKIKINACKVFYYQKKQTKLSSIK